ncbi:MAG: hypothetical protein V4543_12140 [Bacteroidota bacterium]
MTKQLITIAVILGISSILIYKFMFLTDAKEAVKDEEEFAQDRSPEAIQREQDYLDFRTEVNASTDIPKLLGYYRDHSKIYIRFAKKNYLESVDQGYMEIANRKATLIEERLNLLKRNMTPAQKTEFETQVKKFKNLEPS